MSVAALAVYWSMFSLVSLIALAFLAGTAWRSLQLSTARASIDDGSEDEASASWKIYRLSVRSDLLFHASCAALLPLLAGTIGAFAASTVLGKFIALGLATASAAAADLIRARHAGLESAFHGITGTTVREAYARVLRLEPNPQPIAARSDQAATPAP